MRKTKVITILLTIVLFLSVAVLGISTVYRVDAVTIQSSLVSVDARAEIDVLQERLQQAYDKESIFAVDETTVEETLRDFPYLRMTSFTKSFPNRLIIGIAEDAELYTIETTYEQGLYYILNSNGIVLGIRHETANRADGAQNLAILGLQVSGEKGGAVTGDDCLPVLFSFLQDLDTRLEGIRRNVKQVAVLRPASIEEETVIRLSMCEGINVYIRNPKSMTLEKSERVFNAYLSLTSTQKLKGMLMVSDVNGSVIDQYSPIDNM